MRDAVSVASNVAGSTLRALTKRDDMPNPPHGYGNPHWIDTEPDDSTDDHLVTGGDTA